MNRGELLGIRTADVFQYEIHVQRSITPTSEDTSLKTRNSKRDILINKEVFEILMAVSIKEVGYYFNSDNSHQSAQLNIPQSTFHGLHDTHAFFLFS